MKLEIDLLDIVGKLETTPADLGKLCEVVKNEIIKQTVCDELVEKS